MDSGARAPQRGSLHEWLGWMQHLHPRDIDLGIERVAQVLQALEIPAPARTVITVGGTNGKGSCVAFLEAILQAAGYRVGAYTSPHLLRYNERVRVGGVGASDATLCNAFARVEAARGAVPLTYFEFGTLAALVVFAAANLDVALLEVGMGGRLDAVNSIDAHAALVASVGIDHADWLGSDRSSIGREKAGIFRGGCPAVCGDPNPPETLVEHAGGVGAVLTVFGRDFGCESRQDGWIWRGMSRRLGPLPHPRLPGAVQLRNAAAVLMVLDALADRLPVDVVAIRAGLERAYLPGRAELLRGPVEQVLDVAHNPDAAKVLAEVLDARPVPGRTTAVLGMLENKDVVGVVLALRDIVATWHVAGLSEPRGLDGARLAEHVHAAGIVAPVHVHSDVKSAHDAALAEAQPGDRVVVFGSFYTVAALQQSHL